MMDALSTNRDRPAILSFEQFCENIDAKVSAVSQDRILKSFQGRWVPTQSQEIKGNIYTQEMKKIYECAIKNLSPPILPPEAKEDVDVGDRLLLNLILAFTDDQGHITDNDKTKIAAFAIRNNIDMSRHSSQRNDMLRYPFRVSGKMLANEIEAITKEINATRRLIQKLNQLVGELRLKGIDLGPIFEESPNNPKLPLQKQVILKILETHFINKDKITESCRLTKEYLSEIPSYVQCLVEFNLFLARVKPEALDLEPLSEEERTVLLPIIAETGTPLDIMKKLSQFVQDEKPAECEVFYRAAEQIVATDPNSKSLRQDSFLPLLSSQLLERVAEAGNNDALRCLAVLKHKPELDLNARYHFCQSPAKHMQLPADEQLQLELMELGDWSLWKSHAYSYTYTKNIDLALKAIDHNPSISLVIDDSLKVEPSIIERLLKKAQQGDWEAWFFLPTADKNVSNALLTLEASNKFDDYNLGFDLIAQLQREPKFHQLIEDKFRKGVWDAYRLLSDEQKDDRQLFIDAVRANPTIYEKLMDRECQLNQETRTVLASERCPYMKDPEIVRIYLKAFPWAAERLLVTLRNPPWMKAAIRFAELVLLADGYLTLNDNVDSNTKRFYEMGMKLPLDLQMIFAARTEGSDQAVITPQDVEWATRFVFTLIEHAKMSAKLLADVENKQPPSADENTHASSTEPPTVGWLSYCNVM